MRRLAGRAAQWASPSLIVAVGLLVAACGGEAGGPSATGGDDPTSVNGPAGSDAGPADDGLEAIAGAVVANSPGTVTTNGPQRIMTALLGSGARPFVGGPEVPVTITYQSPDDEEAGEVSGRWLTTDASALGLYVSHFEFPAAGAWQVIISTEGSEIARAQLVVSADSSVPAIGQAAPLTESPTGNSPEEIAAISSDLEPDPEFYDLSIAEAVRNDRPSVIAFVTPAFCQTALCGPTLEAVKGATQGRDDIDVIHVEPFDLALATAGDLQPIAAMGEWGLQTEPWVFLVDADGAIQASFEGIIGQAELEAALDDS